MGHPKEATMQPCKTLMCRIQVLTWQEQNLKANILLENSPTEMQRHQTRLVCQIHHIRKTAELDNGL